MGYTAPGEAARAIGASSERIMSLALTPDGLKAVAGHANGTVKLWTLDGTVPPVVLSSPKKPVFSVAIHPAGTRVAAAFMDRSLRIWDAAKGWTAGVLPAEPDAVGRLSFTPDGSRLAVSVGRTIKVFDASTLAVIFQTESLRYRVSSLAFSRDGRRMAAGDTNGNMKVWDGGSGAAVAVIDEDGSGGGDWMAFDPTGTRLAVSSHGNRRVQIWEVSSSRALLQIDLQEGAADRLAFTSDGASLSVLSGDSSVRTFDTRSSYPFDESRLVARLFAQTRLSSEVIVRLRRDRSLNGTTRNTALHLARAQGSNEKRLVTDSMQLTMLPGKNLDEYRRALTYAEAAVQEFPTSVGVADALGLALYRLDRLRESVAAFKRGRDLRGGLEFIEAVFTTMALARLDDEGTEAAGDQLNAFFVGLADIYPLTAVEGGCIAELRKVGAEYNKRHPAEKKK
jgi:hypothetical protein